MAYVTIGTKDGEAIFEFDKSTPLELRAKLTWATSLVQKANPLPLSPSPEVVLSEGVAVDDPSEQLRRLTSLHADGLLSDEEFSAKRAEVIQRL